MAKSNGFIWILILIIIGALVWGLIGSSQSSKIGTTCDFGIGKDSMTGETGSALCWKWHRNAIGEIGDGLRGLFSNK